MLIKRTRKGNSYRANTPPVAALAKELMITESENGGSLEVIAMLHDPRSERRYPGCKNKYGIHFKLTRAEEVQIFNYLNQRRMLYVNQQEQRPDNAKEDAVCYAGHRKNTLAQKYGKLKVPSYAAVIQKEGRRKYPPIPEGTSLADKKAIYRQRAKERELEKQRVAREAVRGLSFDPNDSRRVIKTFEGLDIHTKECQCLKCWPYGLSPLKV